MYITYNQPLKDVNDAWLSMLSAIELFLLLFCALILEVKIDKQDVYDEAVFEGVIFILLIGILIIGKYQIICSIFKIESFSEFCHIIYNGTIGKTINKGKKIVEIFKEYKESKKKKESESLESCNNGNYDTNLDCENDNISIEDIESPTHENYIIRYPTTTSLLSESNYMVDNNQEYYDLNENENNKYGYNENNKYEYNENNKNKNNNENLFQKQHLDTFSQLNLTPIVNNIADNIVSKIKDNVYQEILQINSSSDEKVLNIELDSESEMKKK